ADDVEQVVPRGDARDVRAVRVVVEHEGERRHTAHFTKVGGQRDRLRADGDRLAALAVVVQGHLVLERAVQVRVDERDPAVRRLHDDHGKDIAVAPVTVEIAARHFPEGTLRQLAGIPRGRGREPPDATGAGERPAGDRDGAVPRRGDGARGRDGGGGGRRARGRGRGGAAAAGDEGDEQQRDAARSHG